MRFGRIAFMLLVCASACVPASAADTLGRVRQTHELRLGYFEGSAPFSFTGADKLPQGYSVELCERVAAGIQRQVGAPVKPVWVPLQLSERIEAVRSGRIDIECGTSTWTLSRQQLVDFSLVTFVDGASMLATVASGMQRISDANGKRIAVIGGTSTVRALEAALSREKVAAEIVRMDNREQGLAMLNDGRVDAFASDRFLLMNAATAGSARPLRLLDEDFSVEPYALVLPRGDADFRLAVNRSLADVFRSGEIMRVYDRWLSRLGRPSLLLSALYYLQAIPE
jgi:ABC-type amino acid transport substrate-binding protein